MSVNVSRMTVAAASRMMARTPTATLSKSAQRIMHHSLRAEFLAARKSANDAPTFARKVADSHAHAAANTAKPNTTATLSSTSSTPPSMTSRTCLAASGNSPSNLIIQHNANAFCATVYRSQTPPARPAKRVALSLDTDVCHHSHPEIHTEDRVAPKTAVPRSTLRLSSRRIWDVNGCSFARQKEVEMVRELSTSCVEWSANKTNNITTRVGDRIVFSTPISLIDQGSSLGQSESPSQSGHEQLQKSSNRSALENRQQGDQAFNAHRTSVDSTPMQCSTRRNARNEGESGRNNDSDGGTKRNNRGGLGMLAAASYGFVTIADDDCTEAEDTLQRQAVNSSKSKAPPRVAMSPILTFTSNSVRASPSMGTLAHRPPSMIDSFEGSRDSTGSAVSAAPSLLLSTHDFNLSAAKLNASQLHRIGNGFDLSSTLSTPSPNVALSFDSKILDVAHHNRLRAALLAPSPPLPRSKEYFDSKLDAAGKCVLRRGDLLSEDDWRGFGAWLASTAAVHTLRFQAIEMEKSSVQRLLEGVLAVSSTISHVRDIFFAENSLGMIEDNSNSNVNNFTSDQIFSTQHPAAHSGTVSDSTSSSSSSGSGVSSSSAVALKDDVPTILLDSSCCDNVLSGIMKLLFMCSGVESVGLVRQSLTDCHLPYLAPLFYAHPSLLRLSLSFNAFTSSCSKHFAQHLRKIVKMKSPLLAVDLSYNSLGANGVQDLTLLRQQFARSGKQMQINVQNNHRANSPAALLYNQQVVNSPSLTARRNAYIGIGNGSPSSSPSLTPLGLKRLSTLSAGSNGPALGSSPPSSPDSLSSSPRFHENMLPQLVRYPPPPHTPSSTNHAFPGPPTQFIQASASPPATAAPLPSSVTPPSHAPLSSLGGLSQLIRNSSYGMLPRNATIRSPLLSSRHSYSQTRQTPLYAHVPIASNASSPMSVATTASTGSSASPQYSHTSSTTHSNELNGRESIHRFSALPQPVLQPLSKALGTFERSDSEDEEETEFYMQDH